MVALRRQPARPQLRIVEQPTLEQRPYQPVGAALDLMYKIGLALIATGTAIFFALPLRTFATYPVSYRLMASVLGEGQWAATYAGVALLTWLALWLEGDGPRGA